MLGIRASETYSSEYILEGSFQAISKGISSIAIFEGIRDNWMRKCSEDGISAKENYRRDMLMGQRFNDRSSLR